MDFVGIGLLPQNEVSYTILNGDTDLRPYEGRRLSPPPVEEVVGLEGGSGDRDVEGAVSDFMERERALFSSGGG